MKPNNTSHLKLYHYEACPYCQKVRKVMNDLDLKIELVNAHEEKHREELIKNGGKRQVPCLRIEEDNKVKWLYESDDIISYLKKHYS